MAIDKNFVVKNGLEVNNNLILADANSKRVGISSLNPKYTLDVAGGIGATHSYITGFSTVFGEFNIGIGGTVLTGVGDSIGIGTANPLYLLDVRGPVSTGKTSLFVRGDVYITGDITADDFIINSATVDRLYVTSAIDASGSLFVVGLSTFSSYVGINSSVGILNDLLVSGISTFGSYVDINNSVDISNNLQVTGLSTFGNYVDINNSVDISNGLNVSGVSTISTLGVTGILTAANSLVSGISTTSSLRVTGVSTLGTLQISAGIVTATSGIITYYGDGQYLNLSSNTSTGIGIGTTGGVVGYGITFLDLKGAGVSTTFYNSNVGIATIFFEGGGSGTIGIGTIFPTTSAGNGDLFYHIDYGRIFVYYDEVVLGIGSTAVWVDAAPFNIGFIDIQDLSLETLTVTNLAGVVKAGIGFTALIVEGDTRITGILTVGTGSLTLNGNTNQINGVTINSGIITATTFSGNLTGNVTGTASTASSLSGSPNINVSNITGVAATFSQNVSVSRTLTSENIDSVGLLTARSGIRIGTVGTASTLGSDGGAVFSGIVTTSQLRIGTTVTGNSSGLNVSGIVTATQLNVGNAVTGNSSGLNVSGIVTATSLRDSSGNVRSIPQNSQSSSYQLQSTDAGRHISITSGNITVPQNTFSVGDAISIYNNSSGSQTILEGSGITMRSAGTANTGNRQLAQYGLCTVLCVASNVFVISGAGLS